MKRFPDPRPLVAHIIYRLDVGGLENGVVNLINHMPEDAYRHMLVSLTEITDFRQRIRRDDVECLALDKRPGHAFRLYPRICRLLRERAPAIVHTRNLAALEASAPAWAAGVPVRIHGEHGLALNSQSAPGRRHQLVRRLYSPFVTAYVALSRDLERYLLRQVGIGRNRVAQIYNGVDTRLFHPAPTRRLIPGCPFSDPGEWLVGTVGRMQEIKDPANLARAFVRAIQLAPQLRYYLRLVLVGDGPSRPAVEATLEAGGVRDLAWLPGRRDDIPDLLRGLDCFVLPSRSEGIANAILEAMASALPVIATDVGGNPELVIPGWTGALVPAADPEALARQMIALARDQEGARMLGRNGRQKVERHFSLDAMVDAYRTLYDRLLLQANSGACLETESCAEAMRPPTLTGAIGSHVRDHGNL